jgi:hypothetical protein
VALELVQQRDPFCLDSRAMSYRRGLRSRQRVLEKEGIDSLGFKGMTRRSKLERETGSNIPGTRNRAKATGPT